MGTSSSQNTQNSITEQQLALSQQQQAQSTAEYNESQTLEAPAISQAQALISGNPGALATATAPYVSNISAGMNSAKEQIMNQGAGSGGVNTAATSYALSQIPIQQATQVAGTENSLVNNAYQTLLNAGTGQQSFSLQNLGAALSGLGGASTSNQSIMQSQEQGKASTMGVLGSLLGAGGEIFEAKG